MRRALEFLAGLAVLVGLVVAAATLGPLASGWILTGAMP